VTSRCDLYMRKAYLVLRESGVMGCEAQRGLTLGNLGLSDISHWWCDEI
jgi:hypothetical protein